MFLFIKSASVRLASSFRKAGISSRLLLFVSILIHIFFLLNLFTGILKPFSHDMTLFREVRGVDFNAIFMSGHYLRSGENLYRIPTQDEGVPHTRFRYTPPAAFFIGLPFSLFPRNRFFTASAFWTVIIELVLIFNILLTIKFCSIEKRILPAVSMWLIYFPFAVELYMGQFTFIMASLFFWSILAIKKNRFFSAVFLWIPSVLLKIFPLLFAPLYVRYAGLRKSALAVLIMTLLVLPWFLFHPIQFNDFLALNLQPGKSIPDTPYAGNPGFFHLALYISQFLPGLEKEAVNIVSLFTGMIILGFFLILSSRRKISLFIPAGLVAASFFFISREVWEHHYTLLLPFFILYFIDARKPDILFCMAFVLCALPTFFIFFNMAGPLGENALNLTLRPVAGLLYFLIKPLGVILFIVALLKIALKHETFSSPRADEI